MTQLQYKAAKFSTSDEPSDFTLMWKRQLLTQQVELLLHLPKF